MVLKTNFSAFFFKIQELLGKVQCRSIQFRERVETNEDTKYDKMGSFYGNIINLSSNVHEDSEVESPVANMNETVVLENKTSDETLIDADRSELILTIVNDKSEHETDDCEEEEEDINSPIPYRPPTPPKMSPKNNSPTFEESSKGT